tara:strand:+ start:79 stop:324 length:246 start_codon:yes stop_codon:yes gene_type:complete
MNEELLNTLQAHFNAKFLRARTNLNVYMSSPVGVGEHGDIVEECVNHIETMEHAKSCVELLNEIVQSMQQVQQTGENNQGA